MLNVDPRIQDKFATILAGTRAKAADISDRVTAKQRENAAAAARMRESNEALTRELDERAKVKAESASDPKNQWTTPERPPPAMYEFGPEEEPAPASPEPTHDATPPAAEAAAPPPVTQQRPGGRHARKDEFDDDDFANNSWMK